MHASSGPDPTSYIFARPDGQVPSRRQQQAAEVLARSPDQILHANASPLSPLTHSLIPWTDSFHGPRLVFLTHPDSCCLWTSPTCSGNPNTLLRRSLLSHPMHAFSFQRETRRKGGTAQPLRQKRRAAADHGPTKTHLLLRTGSACQCPCARVYALGGRAVPCRVEREIPSVTPAARTGPDGPRPGVPPCVHPKRPPATCRPTRRYTGMRAPGPMGPAGSGTTEAGCMCVGVNGQHTPFRF